jgi:hypothetical protein
VPVASVTLIGSPIRTFARRAFLGWTYDQEGFAVCEPFAEWRSIFTTSG